MIAAEKKAEYNRNLTDGTETKTPTELKWTWPEDMVIEFANMWEASEYVATVTGSWLSDREQLPGFWRCVLEYLSIKHYAKEIVKNTLDLVRNNG